MAKDWKRRKKYKSNTEKIENSHKKIRFDLTKFAKREALFVVLSIAAVMIVTISSAYAVFSSIQKAEDYNTIKVGTLEIEFEDTDTGMGNIINLNGAYPESDSEGQQREPYTFKVTNTGSLSAKYKVKILDDEEMIVEDGCVDNLLPKDKIKYSMNGQSPKLLSEVSPDEYEIYEGLLDSGDSDTHSIRIWIDESAGNEVLGTHYHGKIVVESINYEANTLAGITSGNTTENYYAYRTSITSITFNKTMNIPSDGSAVEEWDVSEAGDGSVKAYIVDDGQGTSTYALYIESDGLMKLSSGRLLFSGFTKLKAITGFENVNTSKVISMSAMFTNCTSLVNLDLSNFNTSSVTDMSNMFQTCSSLTNLDLSNFNTYNVKTMNYMFSECKSLVTLDIGSFNTSNLTTMVSLFRDCNSLLTLDLSNFDTSKITALTSTFQNCSSLESLDISSFDTSKVTIMQATFRDCNSLVTLDLNNFDTRNLTSMYTMFYNCNSLTTLNLSGFDTSKVTMMYETFRECSSLVNLEITNFNTSNVITMQGMFTSCSSLTTLDLSNFNTSKVTSMSTMFASCTNLTALDLSSFNTSNVTTMQSMFYKTTLMTEIKASSTWVMAPTTTDMFRDSGVSSLTYV